MTATTDCTNDPLKLVREGTSQEQRFALALNPASAPVNERERAHSMVFAQAYAEYLQYYDTKNNAVDNWKAFFAQDVSVQLAVTAIQDIEYYKSVTKSYFDYLNNLENKSKDVELKKNLGYLFSCVGTLAKQFDKLKDELPSEVSIKEKLQNLIRSQLAPALQKLLAIYQADLDLDATNPAHPVIASQHPDLILLGSKTIDFADVDSQGLSKDWITNSSADWNAYRNSITADKSVYGSGATVFERVNHLATHNLFTTHFDQFLKVYARVVSEAKQALEETLTKWDRHEPHYALFLAFLRLLEYARAEANTLTARHLDFYYRDILRLKEKPAVPGKAHLLVELAKHVTQHELTSGELFKAGKDGQGKDAFFANDRTFVANQAKVADLRTLYRHQNTSKDTLPFQHNRLFASPIANSDDGLGAKLTSIDQSWHPFYNKKYQDGTLKEIKMPRAEIGFAVASHYLWLAEGQREVTLDFTIDGYEGEVEKEWASNITCAFSSEKGWVEKTPTSFKATSKNNIRLTASLLGDEPAVIAYDPKTHGYTFAVTTPVLLIKLIHNELTEYFFPILEKIVLQQVQLQVTVTGLRSFLLSNDFGPIDASKPFLPFGPQPEAGSALVLSSQEVFSKKNLVSCDLAIKWRNKPDLTTIAYLPAEEYLPSPWFDGYKNFVPTGIVTWLKEGKWENATLKTLFASDEEVVISIKPPTDVEFNKQDNAGFQLDAPFSLNAKTGYVRLALSWGLGHKQYREWLANYLTAVANKTPNVIKPTEPYTPEIESLAISYSATQTIKLNSSKKEEFEERSVKIYHLYPFGAAEQHPYLKINLVDPTIYLLPQLKSTNKNFPAQSPVHHEAELYIGLTALQPPQNLALLFQITDGTANPLAEKPTPHIHWSYLCNNEWVGFDQDQVEDHTNELLHSGIITFAVPREASANNTLLPAGMHWIRAVVAEKSDAVCRLQMVVAQALDATFTDKGNDPTFPAKVLPAGTISKLEQPNAAVKKITQPFATFGGRGAELPSAFYTRVSERLRHKDRAIALWDYERLILEAFPQIYKVKCLNHTHYDNNVYKELAAGHVTVVTIPNQQFHNLRDPLRPFTSLALLEEIGEFLRARLSCFVELHVRNPIFEEVWTEFSVYLYEGFDKTFYEKKLQEEITRFLSPWAFPGGGSPTFGGKIYKSVLLNFIEERPYVDYVTDFKLFHKYETKDSAGVKKEVTSPDLTEVEGSKAVSILVSVPADDHKIKVLDAKATDQLSEKCLCDV